MKNRRIPVIVVVVLLVVVAAYYGVRALNAGTSTALKASGTIEATTVNVSPELAGKVQSVLVSEGQTVHAGDVLFRLDDTLLKAQEQAALAGLQAAQSAALTAQAAYASAQAQYTMAQTAARAQARTTAPVGLDRQDARLLRTAEVVLHAGRADCGGPGGSDSLAGRPDER